MQEIRQFKPTLYLLMLLGITGYSVAAQTPGLWALACAGVLLHAWLSRRGRFRPIPRLLTNLITIAILAFVVRDLLVSGNTPVLVVGEFLVLLQLIKLWEQRTNRDYAQLLVLGLLLMVAAAISTASMWFGVLLLIYLFLSLYCCLLFHLKTEAEHARVALGLSEEKLSAATLRQDQRLLPRSMRRLAVFASAVGIVAGVFVFLVFPRGTGGGMFGPLQLRASQVLVGFSDEVSFQNIARLQQNNEPVAYVSLLHNGQPVQGNQTLLLRGMTLNTYTGSRGASTRRYRWMRTDADSDFESHDMIITGEGRKALTRQPSRNDVWEQKITLRPTGSNVLFSIAGATRMRAVNRMMRVRYFWRDGVMESMDLLNEPIEYVVTATGEPPAPQKRPDPLPRRRRPDMPGPIGNWLPTPEQVKDKMAQVNSIDPLIHQFALRPEVSGRDQKGLLADQRGKDSAGNPLPVSPVDERIATSIEQYLRSHYTYTLDLTDTRRIEGRDPLVAFLYDFKKGHCEYFAGAMTLLCQSLGLQARMVVGFHCEPDSFINGYYLVQQSHAHAWVEVLTTTDGERFAWKTFDPTSSIGADTHGGSLWQRARNYLDYLDFSYAKSVIAYDNDRQAGLFQNVQNRLLNSVIRATAGLEPIRRKGLTNWIRGWFANADNANAFWTLCLRLFIVLMTLCLAGALGWFTWERIRLRRRAARIGIGALPTSERIRLAKQLGFYDDLLRLLARNRMVRPRHLTPLEFSRSLLFLPSGTYDTIVRLTELFYRIRFGRAELTTGRRRHLGVVLAKLTTELEGAPGLGTR